MTGKALVQCYVLICICLTSDDLFLNVQSIAYPIPYFTDVIFRVCLKTIRAYYVSQFTTDCLEALKRAFHNKGGGQNVVSESIISLIA